MKRRIPITLIFKDGFANVPLGRVARLFPEDDAAYHAEVATVLRMSLATKRYRDTMAKIDRLNAMGMLDREAIAELLAILRG